MHPTHPGFGSISGPQQRRSLGDNLCEVDGLCAEASSQASEVHDVGPEMLSDLDMVPLCLG